jgi:hypothetical protein
MRDSLELMVSAAVVAAALHVTTVQALHMEHINELQVAAVAMELCT